MATYASIKYDMDLSSNATGTGAMTLLSTQTASSSATISFTSGIDSTYKEYIFKFYDIHPSNDGEEFTFQADTGTNTSYNQTITSTYFLAEHNEADTSTGLTYQTSRDQAQATGFQHFGVDTGKLDELVASRLTIEEIKNAIKADSLQYLSINGLEESMDYKNNYCLGCFTKKYPIPVQLEMDKMKLEEKV